VFALTCDESLSAVEVAENTIRLSGLRPHTDIEIELYGDADDNLDDVMASASETDHANIRAVSNPHVDPESVGDVPRRLESLARSSDDEEVRSFLAETTSRDGFPTAARGERASAVASGTYRP